jgi:uncharacterized integral membrane protein (TIGR00697 family)
VKFKEYIKKDIRETKVLLREIPALSLAVFSVALIVMNLLAGKLIVNTDIIALDAGIIVSWVSFLVMDTLVKRFGPKAATKITLIAILINLLVTGVFSIAAAVPGEWGEGHGDAIDRTIAGNWHVVLASTVAFTLSAIINNVLHFAVKKGFKNKPDSFLAYAVSSYTSTMIAQFIDNFAFALLFTFLNGWITLPAALSFAAVGAAVEILFQIIFSPIGYFVAEKWRKNGVGDKYLELLAGGKKETENL